MAEAHEGELSYQSVNGTTYPDSKTVIFDANATAGTGSAAAARRLSETRPKRRANSCT